MLRGSQKMRLRMKLNLEMVGSWTRSEGSSFVPQLCLCHVRWPASHVFLPREGVKCLHSKASVPPQVPNLDQYLNGHGHLLPFTLGWVFLVGSVDNQKLH